MQEQFQFSAFIHRLGQNMRVGTPESVEALFGEYFGMESDGKALLYCERLQSERFLTLFTLLLTFLRENELSAPYDRMLTRLLDGALRGENRAMPPHCAGSARRMRYITHSLLSIGSTII